VGGTGFRGTAFDEPSAVTGSASSESAGGLGFGAAGGAGFLGAVTGGASSELADGLGFGGAVGFAVEGAGVLGAVTGGASSELAGGLGFGAVGAAGFAAGGAGFLGAAPNELRAIAGFLGLGLAGGGDAAAAADFPESEVGFPGPVPFGPTASAR
jgi:hypothetical protein